MTETKSREIVISKRGKKCEKCPSNFEASLIPEIGGRGGGKLLRKQTIESDASRRQCCQNGFVNVLQLFYVNAKNVINQECYLFFKYLSITIK